MPRKKQYNGFIGVKIPKEHDDAIRGFSKATGRSLSDLLRETITIVWGKRSEDLADQLAQAGTA